MEKKIEPMKVTYLGHSGWSVEIRDSVLIFDCMRPELIDPKKFDGLKTYVLFSHEHDDHYNEATVERLGAVEHLRCIKGWRDLMHKEHHELLPNRDYRIEELEIRTIASTDEGVGFLVELHGVSVVHFGDHANWDDAAEADFKSQVDFFAERNSEVDLAFVPVAKGSGAMPQCMTNGAIYVMEKLNPQVVFPMHGGEREHLYKEFKSRAEGADLSTEIICMSELGEAWNNGARSDAGRG